MVQAYNKMPYSTEKGQVAPKTTWMNFTNIILSEKSKTHKIENL